MVQSPLIHPGCGEITTTGRYLTISGGLKPGSKSHIHSVPGSGWKFSGTT